MQWGLSSTLDSIGSQVFIRKTAGELLFDGYEDPLLSIAEWIGTKSSVPIDKFGWFYKVGSVTIERVLESTGKTGAVVSTDPRSQGTALSRIAWKL